MEQNCVTFSALSSQLKQAVKNMESTSSRVGLITWVKLENPKLDQQRVMTSRALHSRLGSFFIETPNNACIKNNKTACKLFDLQHTGNVFGYLSLQPDLKRFGMEVLEEDICKVFKRRAYDVAASVKGVKVFLNGEKLNVRGNIIMSSTDIR